MVGENKEPTKTSVLDGLGLDKEFLQNEVIRPLVKDYAKQIAKEKLGLKGSELRKNSKAFHISTFLKEITWPVIELTVAAIVMYTLTVLSWRLLKI